MKILLDIDGVMIPLKPWQTYRLGYGEFGMFSEFSVEGLNKIIKSSPNPEIVLTTSHKQSYSLDDWKIIFSDQGILKTEISKLNTNSLKISRIDEIKSWYLNNQNEPFIVIDDDKGLNGLNTDFKEDHLVLTKPTIGLDNYMTDKAIRKINLQKL